MYSSKKSSIDTNYLPRTIFLRKFDTNFRWYVDLNGKVWNLGIRGLGVRNLGIIQDPFDRKCEFLLSSDFFFQKNSPQTYKILKSENEALKLI
jgi:hypothetical protein